MNKEEILRLALYTRLRDKLAKKYKELWMDKQRKWKNPQ